MKINNIIFLGIIADQNLNWKAQNRIHEKQHHKICKIILQYKEVHAIKHQFHAQINSRLMYALEIWGQASHKIHIMQKLILIIIFPTGRRRTQSAPLFHKCNVLTIYQLHKVKLNTFIFILFNNKHHPYYNSKVHE